MLWLCTVFNWWSSDQIYGKRLMKENKKKKQQQKWKAINTVKRSSGWSNPTRAMQGWQSVTGNFFPYFPMAQMPFGYAMPRRMLEFVVCKQEKGLLTYVRAWDRGNIGIWLTEMVSNSFWSVIAIFIINEHVYLYSFWIRPYCSGHALLYWALMFIAFIAYLIIYCIHQYTFITVDKEWSMKIQIRAFEL